MIVDKDKVQKAKERLGDRTPTLIAEILNLQEFDDVSMKSLCPVHREDTPSFIYNPKMLNYHCFGCGCNVDIIDAYMMSGATYLESVEKLFCETGVSYSFGERGVRTQRGYRYPSEVPAGKRDIVDTYCAARGISKSTLDHCDVRQDEHGNVVFNYYDLNDVLTMVKYRPSHKIDKSKGEVKSWCQKGADTKPLLFNMNRINVNQPLLICEGELDSMAAIESGYTNAVSVPLGSQNHHWIEENWDWLDQFEEIIVCADNDKPGIKMVQEVCPRLGTWRTKVVNIPFKDESTGKSIKDLNELLYYQGKQAVMDAVLNAKDSPIDSVVDLSDVNDININDIDGIYFGFEQLDSELFRLFYGTLTLVTGLSGAGKTSFLYQIVCNALDQGKGAWIFSRELPDYMSKNWMNYLLSGPRNVEERIDQRGCMFSVVGQAAKKAINEHYRGQWYVYKNDWPNDVESIKESMEASARKYGTKFFLLDNLMTIDLHSSSENTNEKQTELINWLIQFSSRFKVCVVLVAHPKKTPNTGGALELFDISGSSNITNLAHRTLSLRRVRKEEKEAGTSKFSDFDCVISVTKDRILGKAGFELGLHYDIASRRFFTNYAEYDRRYSWDRRVYDSPIPCPALDTEHEVYGSRVPQEDI